MDHGVSSRLALSAPSNPESKSPRVERAQTDAPNRLRLTFSPKFLVVHGESPRNSDSDISNNKTILRDSWCASSASADRLRASENPVKDKRHKRRSSERKTHNNTHTNTPNNTHDNTRNDTHNDIIILLRLYHSHINDYTYKLCTHINTFVIIIISSSDIIIIVIVIVSISIICYYYLYLYCYMLLL